jgi:GTPase SAR1 family protein
MTTEIAKDIDETYRTCDPDLPLEADDERYVDLAESRGMKRLAKTIARSIKRSAEHSQVKMLFTGLRGSGKTTELFRLKKELEDNQYFTLYMDVEELLDLGSLNYLDVLVAIAKQVQVTLHDQGMPISEDLLNNIADWFAETIIVESRQESDEAAIKTDAKVGVKIPFFKIFANITANIKAGSS